MKKFKSFSSILLVLVMIFAMTSMAFAYTGDYKINIKNTNESITIDGTAYFAYKLFDVTYNNAENPTAFSYTIAPEFAGDTEKGIPAFSFDGKSDKELVAYVATLSNDAKALDDLANAAYRYAEANRIDPKGWAFAGTNVHDEATISVPEAGYYIVAGPARASVGSQPITASCALTTTKPTANVFVKADAPSINKVIVNNGEDVKVNNAAIGDTVNYKLTSRVPNMTGYNKYFFIVEDTMSAGLTFNKDVRITVDGVALDDDAFDVNYDSAANTFKIVFKNFIQYRDSADKAIEITYSAYLNKNALINVANTNTAKLVYSNNPTEIPDSDNNTDVPGDKDSTGSTPKSTVETYVTQVVLHKENVDELSLAGAEFQIKGRAMNWVKVTGTNFVEDAEGTYYQLNNLSYTDVEPTDANKSAYKDTIKKYKIEDAVWFERSGETPIVATGVTGADGNLTFTGISAGEYTITEIVAPDGYNLLEKPITLVIGFDETTKTFSYNWSSTELGSLGNNPICTVVNQSGTELPSTGGIGTTIFYVLGAILVLSAGVVLIAKRRMQYEK